MDFAGTGSTRSDMSTTSSRSHFTTPGQTGAGFFLGYERSAREIEIVGIAITGHIGFRDFENMEEAHTCII